LLSIVRLRFFRCRSREKFSLYPRIEMTSLKFNAKRPVGVKPLPAFGILKAAPKFVSLIRFAGVLSHYKNRNYKIDKIQKNVRVLCVIF
jgi:hypothetical protein